MCDPLILIALSILIRGCCKARHSTPNHHRPYHTICLIDQVGHRGRGHHLKAKDTPGLIAGNARLKELTARIEKRSTKKAVAAVSLSKELVLRKLMENAERAEAVKGGSNVVTRCWELIGKHLGMWQDKPEKPLTAEDLTIEQLEEILNNIPKAPVQ